MLECKDGDETIDIQMTDEVFKAEWIPLDKMSHFRFTNLGRNVGRVLTHNEPLDLSKMSLGDVFKDASFTVEEYEQFGSTQRFFSSEYLRKVGDLIKSSQSKL